MPFNTGYICATYDCDLGICVPQCPPSSYTQNSQVQMMQPLLSGLNMVYPDRSGLDEFYFSDHKQTAGCLRCQFQRIRCAQKISNIPCLRYKIPDVVLYRTGNVPGLEWTMRWVDTSSAKDLETWASSELRTIQITQDYSPAPLTVKVRRFIPEKGDSLKRKWHDGKDEKFVVLPPYAFADLKATEQAYISYINQEGTEFFKSGLDPGDKLVWETYSAAIKASNHTMTEPERKLIKMVLRLWVATRMTCKPSRICGTDTLGIPFHEFDRSSPMHGKVPIPPIMGAQIDLILLQAIQIPLRTQILEQLQNFILANKPSHWFCIYLCVFVILHNCALLTQNDAWYARKHGLEQRFASPKWITELQTSVNILLAYFHSAIKGQHPLQSDWNAEDATSMAGLNAEQIQFIQKTACYVQMNKARFQELHDKNKLEHEHYFVAQLYEMDWKPRPTS